MATKLYIEDNNGGYRVASEEEVVYGAKGILKRKFRKGAAITTPDMTRDYLVSQLSEREHEIFGILFLDNRHRVIAFEELFRGTIDGASVHPREVVKRALLLNAAAVILTHNHPSGKPEPSRADIQITRRLVDALGLLDVRVLDHVIVGGVETISFAERGLI